jgi:cell division protein FtsZ
MEFDMPKEITSIIKVVGVGGGGSNAVNHMYNLGIKGVEYIVCNTDCQALDISPIATKIQLGPSLTEGRGAGSIPEIGRNAVIENIDEISDMLSKNTKMVFVTAGMGGGTGTGAAPVIAKLAKDMGILTVGIVTVPFNFEGRKRRQQAEEGLEEMRKNVDTLLVINNERLREMYGNLSLGNAFSQADDVVSTAAKGIAEVISVTGSINVDFNDVNTVLKDSGVAIMGSAVAEGENRAIEAVQRALTSPLLNDNNIEGAQYVLLNITYGDKEVLMDEIADITDYIQDEAGSTADVIWGHAYDASLGESICVTLIATGFNSSPVTGFEKAPERNVRRLDDEVTKEITKPIENPFQSGTTNTTVVERNEELPFLKTVSVNEQKEVVEPKTTTQPEVNKFDLEDENVNPTFEFEQAKEELPSFDWDMDSEVTEEVTFNNSIQEETVTNWSENTIKHTSENKQEELNKPVATEEKAEQGMRYMLEDDVQNELEDTSTSNSVLTPEEQQRKIEERMLRIRDYTSKLKKPEGISELEQEPAYIRRNIEFNDTPHSSESNVSRYGLFENEEGKSDLRGNNSFLHDNVD